MVNKQYVFTFKDFTSEKWQIPMIKIIAKNEVDARISLKELGYKERFWLTEIEQK